MLPPGRCFLSLSLFLTTQLSHLINIDDSNAVMMYTSIVVVFQPAMAHCWTPLSVWVNGAKSIGMYDYFHAERIKRRVTYFHVLKNVVDLRFDLTFLFVCLHCLLKRNLERIWKGRRSGDRPKRDPMQNQSDHLFQERSCSSSSSSLS